MKLDQGPILTLEEARAFIRRAIAKAEDLAACGAIVVVNDGGVLVSASRMDGAGLFGIPVSRAKAYAAATMREPSAEYAARAGRMFMGIFLAFQSLARDELFPGAGAVPIRRDGKTLGAISTGAGIGPFVKWPGLNDPMKLVVQGQPTNAEDLVISYALGQPYAPQHGDDMERWKGAYGSAPSGAGTGMAEVPDARKQSGLASAIALSDAAMAEAKRRGAAVAVAVVDRNGDAVQLDCMDGAAPMSPDTAQAVAVMSVNFQSTSEAAAKAYRDVPQLSQLADVVPFRFLPIPGGVPILDGNSICGALGVGGPDPKLCAEIAQAALAAVPK